jgi:hypothetical protein
MALQANVICVIESRHQCACACVCVCVCVRERERETYQSGVKGYKCVFSQFKAKKKKRERRKLLKLMVEAAINLMFTSDCFRHPFARDMYFGQKAPYIPPALSLDFISSFIVDNGLDVE